MSKMIDEMLAAIQKTMGDVVHVGVSKLDGAPVGS